MEEARTWIEETGLCLFLPRRQFSTAVAPSFVEAVIGRRDPTPNPPQIAIAEELLVRLELDGVAVRLNLLGQPGEQPDFVVAGWVLPYVYALRGDRDWRRNPQLTGSRQVSPLAVQTWKLLEAEETNLSDLTHNLGREVTETAVLRAIAELWQQLRIIPVIDAPGKPARWQLLRTRFQKAIAEGASTSQVTAISVLASIYLQAVIAATMEEVEIFLSPLTARSKVREVLRGLVATRQVHTITLGHAPHFYVAGTLPEFDSESAYSNILPSTSYYLGNLDDEEDVIPAPVSIYSPVEELRPVVLVQEEAAVREEVVAVVLEESAVEEEEETEEEVEAEEPTPAPAPEAKPLVSVSEPKVAAVVSHEKPIPARAEVHRPHTSAKPVTKLVSKPGHAGSHPAADAHKSRAAHPARPAVAAKSATKNGAKSPAHPAGKPKWSDRSSAGNAAGKGKAGAAHSQNGLRPKPAEGSAKAKSGGKAAPAWKKSAQPADTASARNSAHGKSSARPAAKAHSTAKPAARSAAKPHPTAKPAARPASGHSARPVSKSSGGTRSGARNQGTRKRG